MASKTISLQEDTYERLRRAKGEDESFTDVIERLLREDEHPLYDLVGILDREEADRVRDRARRFREDVDDRVATGNER